MVAEQYIMIIIIIIGASFELINLLWYVVEEFDVVFNIRYW